MTRQRPTRLVMGPCIVEIDRIVIREVQYQLEVNRCRNEEIIVKGSFSGVAYVGGAPQVEIDCIVIKEFQYQFEAILWPMWAGRPRFRLTYQFEVNRCRNEVIIVGRPRVGNGAMHNNRCRNEDIFQGFSAYSDGRTEDGDNHNIPTFFPKSMGIITYNKNMFTNMLSITYSTESVIKLIVVGLLDMLFDDTFSAIVSSFDQDSVLVEVKNVAPSPRGHVIHPTGLFFKLSRDIIRTNVMTKFHKDLTKTKTLRVLTRKTAPLPESHLIYCWDKIVLTKFHENWTKTKTLRVLKRKNALPPGSHFHEDWTINVASRELTR
ncbi:hypothetical protein DPMN_002671 [Dreissena polymorpha]|uniref:Uncharacterized protein n=1 Tax=Dreissena polymorpha TaxID=45954 RepID=A0A9D4MP69_DREPO|nr:hypothetical protein DPMN_002671 [Dreissena polymorpha]